jgi:serine/threonine protein kinase
LHSHLYIHRDLKPENFLIGIKEDRKTIYMVDFGLAKRYIDRETKEHIPFRDDHGLTGTARYASINNHMGMEMSRRDDLEALGYIIVYFFKGNLPWQGQKGRNDKVLQIKIQTTTETLCEGIPEEMIKFLEYCKDLGYDEKPDYKMLRRLIHQIAESRDIVFDYEFDWNLHPEEINIKDDKN